MRHVHCNCVFDARVWHPRSLSHGYHSVGLNNKYLAPTFSSSILSHLYIYKLMSHMVNHVHDLGHSYCWNLLLQLMHVLETTRHTTLYWNINIQ
jgi:hypothetical protein